MGYLHHVYFLVGNRLGLKAEGNPKIAEYGKATQFTKTRRPKNPGPLPSKIRAYIKENDLGTKDVQAAIRHLAELTEDELKAVYDDQTAPVLLRGFAGAMADEIKKHGLGNLETLLNRAFGKPKETIEVPDGIKIQLEFINPNQIERP